MSALLLQGQSGDLDTDTLIVTVDNQAGIDLAALLLTTAGTVTRSHAVISAGQPRGPGIELLWDRDSRPDAGGINL
ncbi:hypothetical protein NN3_46490 [Nocardia neocaledoniensis NBRC 108232]|uniref:Uncharacterized protein n=1 Tax=Nocardia neocaledoniensis TaxID=236511 RepID=A0A317NBN2_9NOCA|nr:hypothetical protein [Nocardia neocaledoniensis]PWV72313.1 hypothetical protein DFR69_109230 [Nocardia neocaledoniensis]GEM33642.1 hypothetical protein NN3_46490 [Nocardia neocaledoniensis NBRC 108232]